MGKVSFKRDIDCQIERLRKRGYKQAKKIPRRLARNKNRYFVKSLSGVLNIYAIINEYGRVYHHFDLQESPFLKMVKELEAVTKLYKKYNKNVRPYFRKYEGKLIGQKETQEIFALTRKNGRLMEKAGRERLDFLRKYRDFYELCVRFTSAPDVAFLFSFRLGPTMKKTDRSLFFEFFDAVLENHNAYVETAGRPKGTGVTYTDEGVERAQNRYKEREKDCKAIFDDLRKSPFPYRAQELAGKYNIPADLLRNVIKGLGGEAPRVTLRTLTLSVLDWEIFGEVKINPEYLRKKLQRRKSHSQSY